MSSSKSWLIATPINPIRGGVVSDSEVRMQLTLQSILQSL